MPELHRVPVRHATGQYDIVIGTGLLSDPSIFSAASGRSAALIVSNAAVASRYAGALQQALRTSLGEVGVLELPDGEAYKTVGTLETIVDRLLADSFDRQSVLFALGGGVVGDITGFAAATYMRGIDHVQVPTTLLAQTDSSVGGKTAVNHPRGKNMIGAFHPPLLVVVDLDTLDSLPEREYVSGLAEVIKYGAVADDEFLGWLEANLSSLLARERTSLAYAVKRSCEIKADVVGRDEREGGVRAILNFGHTTAHAIETGMGYGAWLHGEAVATGMVVAAGLSADLGMMDRSDVDRLGALLERAGLPTRTPVLTKGDYLELMRNDKKSARGRLKFVLLEALGHATVRAVDDDDALAAIEARRGTGSTLLPHG